LLVSPHQDPRPPLNPSQPAPAGPPARVALLAAPASLPADGTSQAAVVIWLADAAGRPVAEGSRVRLALSGAPAELARTEVETHEGLALAWLRAGSQPGRVTLTAKIDG